MPTPAVGVGTHADFFLKIDGIQGESKAKGHSDQIDLIAWNWSASQPGSAGIGRGAGVGKVKMEDFEFTKHVDKASPLLMLKCASGEHIPQMTLTCRKAGGEQQEYLKITLKEAIVSSYKTDASGDAALPIETITVNFAKIQVDYKPQDEKGQLGGTVTAGWDLQQNSKI